MQAQQASDTNDLPMPKTTPTSEILTGAVAAVDLAKQSAEAGYGLFPGIVDTLRQYLHRLSPDAVRCLPEDMDDLPLFSLEDRTGQDLVATLESTRAILKRALAFVDFRQQEKIPFTEAEALRVGALAHESPSFSSMTMLWDADLIRIDEAQHDHRWLPDDWETIVGGEGANIRRMAVRKPRDIVACLLMEVQRKRGQHLLLNILEHPATPGSAEELLDHFLQNEIELPIVRMCVREHRAFAWQLLRKKGFKAKGTIRNHYRRGTEHQDGFLLEYQRPGAA